MWSEWTKERDEYFSHMNIKCYEYSWTEQEEDTEVWELLQQHIEELAARKRYYMYAIGDKRFPIPIVGRCKLPYKQWDLTKDNKIIRSIKKKQDTPADSHIYTYGVCEVTGDFLRIDALNWIQGKAESCFLLMTEEDRPLEELMSYYEKGLINRKILSVDRKYYIEVNFYDVNFIKLIENEVIKDGIVVMLLFSDGTYHFCFFMRSDYQTSLDNT